VSFEEAAVGRYPLRLKEVHVEDDDKIASLDQPSQFFAADDARVVVDFTVGPPGLTLLLNVTPVNAAKAWADFERSDFGTVPILRLRPLEFEPLDREVLQPPWVRPRWLDVPGAGERLDKLRAGVSVIDLYEGDGSG